MTEKTHDEVPQEEELTQEELEQIVGGGGNHHGIENARSRGGKAKAVGHGDIGVQDCPPNCGI